MKIMITGAAGMLGRALLRRLAAHEPVGVDLADFDLVAAPAVDHAVRSLRPEVVIHCAAMTNVDRCEGEADAAFRANAIGSANLAHACEYHGSRLIAFSTDYVFAGDLDRPYHEWDAPQPRTVYGQSKLAGEEAIRRHCPDHLILRIAWLYGAGGPSFLHTMLRLGREGGGGVKVVADQHGNPTSAEAVAARVEELLELPVAGTFHLSCEGETTWHGFASEAFRLTGLQRALVPCTTAEFPRPAPRPANSRLEKRALRLHGFKPMPDWQAALAEFLAGPH